MALYELDFDEGIILQSTTALLGGTTEEEFEDLELLELIVTNKRVIYVLDISTGFFKSKTEVKTVPLSSIKVINGVPLVKQVKHDLWGHSIQVQFAHGVEYWTLNKKTIPEWVQEINRLLAGEQEETKKAPILAEETADQNQEQKNSDSEMSTEIKSVLEDVANTVGQTLVAVVEQIQEKESQSVALKDESVVEQVEEKTAAFQEERVRRFCSNCGNKLGEGAKFCQECGASANGASVINAEPVIQERQPAKTESVVVETAQPFVQQNERQQKYIGAVLKCPHCGGVISETTAVCPECGKRITGRVAVNSVLAFKEQLMEIEAGRKKSAFGILSVYAAADPVDKKKLTLIQNFPVPNTVDDILEFIMLAIANIDVSLSKKTLLNSSQGMQVLAIEMPKAISNAWVAKMQQAYQKAEILFPNDPAFSGIQRLYYEKMKELKIKIKK